MSYLLLEKALDLALPETTPSNPPHATIEITEEPLPVPAPVRLQPPATLSFNPSPSGPMGLTPEGPEWELIAEFVLEHDDKQIKMPPHQDSMRVPIEIPHPPAVSPQLFLTTS